MKKTVRQIYLDRRSVKNYSKGLLVTADILEGVYDDMQGGLSTYIKNTPELAAIPPGAIADGIVSTTKGGALATATYSKMGNFDKIQVVDGNNSAYVRFEDFYVCDNRAIVKAKVKVVDYHPNPAVNTLLGLGFHQRQLTDDTGSVGMFHIYFDLSDKKIYYRNNSSGAFVDVTSSFAVSADTLAASGDIVELTLQRLPELDGFQASFVNTTTGQYICGRFLSPGLISRALQIGNSNLRLDATNGTFALLEFKALSSAPASPFLYVMGDSYASGDVNVMSTLFPSLLQNNANYYTVCGAGNGAYIHSMAKHQLQEVIKLKPHYVLLMSVLSVYYGYYNSGTAKQTEFENSFHNIMKAIRAYGGVAILVKWQLSGGGYLNGHSATWNAYVDAAVVAYPGTLVLDLTTENLDFAATAHPSASDHLKIYNQLTALLNAAEEL